MSLPAADDLFRPTVVPRAPASEPAAGPEQDPAGAEKVEPAPSGRVRHDEKMTVYVTSDELLNVEHARLMMRRNGLAVDRGRLIREAVAIALADFEANGDDSLIVQRLIQS